MPEPLRHRDMGASARAELERMALAKAGGEVVDLGAMRKAALTVTRLVRNRLNVIPARVAPPLAAAMQPARVRALLDAKIGQILGDIARLLEIGTRGDAVKS